MIALPRLTAFLHNRAGNIPIMTGAVLIPIMLMSGGAVDLVGHERIRVAVQDALDRGVLAAASLTQTESPQSLVESYLRTVPGASGYTVRVQEEKRVNFRKVTAEATVSYKTSFLRLAGIHDLNVDAASQAQESRSNIEMSMVLDISGSMYDNGGLALLKPAAKKFLDTVLKEEVRNVTSVSIVPFSGTVNVGKKVFDYLAKIDPEAGRHRPFPGVNSSCFEMDAVDFASDVLPDFPNRGQVSQFSNYSISSKGKQPWWCPDDAQENTITFPTNDLDKLKARIDAFLPYDGTGTAYGMKWGEMLLNPRMRPTIQAIIKNGLTTVPVPSQFSNRPVAFTDETTLKFIVLMTDGQIIFQPRPTKEAADAREPKGVFDDKKNLTKYPNYELYSSGKATTLYNQVCDYAKKEGITIFTIAFKVSDSIAKSIAKCASSPSFAYNVQNVDMSSAFQSIASAMSKIRLTN